MTRTDRLLKAVVYKCKNWDAARYDGETKLSSCEIGGLFETVNSKFENEINQQMRIKINYFLPLLYMNYLRNI